MFSTLAKTNFNISVTAILLSANGFNLDLSEILSFGKELRFPNQLKKNRKEIGLFTSRKNTYSKPVWPMSACAHSEHLGQSLDVCRRINMLRNLTYIAGSSFSSATPYDIIPQWFKISTNNRFE